MKVDDCIDCKYHRTDYSDYNDDGSHVPNGCIKIIHVCCRLPNWYKDIRKFCNCPGKLKRV